MATDTYDASAIEVLRSMPPARRRPDEVVATLPDQWEDVLRCWQGRRDARLNAVADVVTPVGKHLNRSILTALNELGEAGLLVIPDGLLLTDTGKWILEGILAHDPPFPGTRQQRGSGITIGSLAQ